MKEDGLCDWKMVPVRDYAIGVVSSRCGDSAEVRIVRVNRKKDLFLCPHHHEVFVTIYGDTLPIEQVR